MGLAAVWVLAAQMPEAGVWWCVVSRGAGGMKAEGLGSCPHSSATRLCPLLALGGRVWVLAEMPEALCGCWRQMPEALCGCWWQLEAGVWWCVVEGLAG